MNREDRNTTYTSVLQPSKVEFISNLVFIGKYWMEVEVLEETNECKFAGAKVIFQTFLLRLHTDCHLPSYFGRNLVVTWQNVLPVIGC
jgi:hypothetical protein